MERTVAVLARQLNGPNGNHCSLIGPCGWSLCVDVGRWWTRSKKIVVGLGGHHRSVWFAKLDVVARLEHDPNDVGRWLFKEEK